MTEQEIKTYLKNGMPPIHPGEILKEEFLDPLNMSANRLAEALHVTPTRLYEIVAGRRGITANTAIRLGIAFGTTTEFWMNLQVSYDIRMQEITVGDDIAKEVHFLEEMAEVGKYLCNQLN